MTRFDTRVAGIPCQCEVTYYAEPQPMRGNAVDGWTDPSEPEEFEYELYDTNGRRAEWLECKLTDDDDRRLLAEFKTPIEDYSL